MSCTLGELMVAAAAPEMGNSEVVFIGLPAAETEAGTPIADLNLTTG